MTIILIIALVAGMLCVAAWKNPRYCYPSNTIMGTLERIRGYVGTSPCQETGDVAVADNPATGFTIRDEHGELLWENRTTTMKPIDIVHKGYRITGSARLKEQTTNDDE